jgi:hypothetical protein
MKILIDAGEKSTVTLSELTPEELWAILAALRMPKPTKETV